MDQTGTGLLVFIFVISSVVIWLSGIKLSKVTDYIDEKYDLGDAFGGMIILSIVTNLPEIAIIISGAMRHDLSLATGNILGGIAVQTVVLVVLDFYRGKNKHPLSTLASSAATRLEAVLVIIILTITIIGAHLKNELILIRFSLPETLIFIFWIAGLWMINRVNIKLPESKIDLVKTERFTPASSFAWLFITAAATLVCGVLLEQSSVVLAQRMNMDGVIFGATILAVITSLPELSTGIASVKLKDYELAYGDIFGGNAFLPVLFLLASVISGQNVLSQCTNSDVYLTAVGILLTGIYLAGLIIKSELKILGIGFDSFIVLIVYVLSIVGLIFV
ncbi:MAG: sodium:calcium antiporter [Bacteroidia bacterium]